MRRLLPLLVALPLLTAAETPPLPATYEHPAATALRTNPLRTRADLTKALTDLYEPVRAHRVPGGLRLGKSEAHYPERTALCEAQLRPLWGLAPLAEGGGTFAHWDEVRQAICEGTDPKSPGFWGLMTGMDQRMVEMAPLATALLIAPQVVWEPLTPAQRANLLTWLKSADTARKPLVNNWAFFRVLAHLAVKRLGGTYDEALHAQDLANIEACYQGEGWYSDGPNPQVDYYIPMAMHYYGLVYARVAAAEDPERCARFKERAARFAKGFPHWFTPRGDALPFGRSLTYRFAQGAFWSALAYADVQPEGMTRGQVKGLLLRHLRWWFQQPILTGDGLLSIGYTYPNHAMAEYYNAPGSPYWATKALIALALPEDGPFWSAPEEPLPARPAQTVQAWPGMVITHDDERHLTVALGGGQRAAFLPLHSSNKYGKFAYSTSFPFCALGAGSGVGGSGQDSTLSFSDDGQRFRSREVCSAAQIRGTTLVSRWKPWPDVTVETWLAPRGTDHVRIHHVTTARELTAAEAGFGLPRTDDSQTVTDRRGSLAMEDATGASLVVDLVGGGSADTALSAPGLNLAAAVVHIPYIKRTLAPGEHWLAAGVAALPGPGAEATVRARLTDLRWEPAAAGQPARIVAADGSVVLAAEPFPEGNALDRGAKGPR